MCFEIGERKTVLKRREKEKIMKLEVKGKGLRKIIKWNSNNGKRIVGSWEEKEGGWKLKKGGLKAGNETVMIERE